MRVTVRPAQDQDLPELLRLIQDKRYPESRLEGVTPQRRKASDQESLKGNWSGLLQSQRVSILVAQHPGRGGLLAYGIAGLDQRDFATGQAEAVLIEHAGDLDCYPALLDFLKEQIEDEFLALRVFPEQAELKDCLRQCGFAPEFVRVVRNLKEIHQPVLAPGLSIRPARNSDRAFLAKLHVGCSPFYESSNRNRATWESLTALDHYLSLDFSGDLRGWVAELDSKACGYVLIRQGFELELSSEPGAYLYDIAVKDGQRGRNLVSCLHEVAAGQLGCSTLVGDISAHNQAALGVALGKLHYQVEWERWGTNL